MKYYTLIALIATVSAIKMNQEPEAAPANTALAPATPAVAPTPAAEAPPTSTPEGAPLATQAAPVDENTPGAIVTNVSVTDYAWTPKKKSQIAALKNQISEERAKKKFAARAAMKIEQEQRINDTKLANWQKE